MLKYYLMAVAAGIVLALYLPGCNTVKGVGKDIHDSAQAVQVWVEGSNENKETLSNGATASR